MPAVQNVLALNPVVVDIGLSVLSGALLFGAAQLIAWLVSRNQSIETQRLWRLTFRHVGAVILVFCLGAIWKAQLQAVLLALGAAAAGVMLAFREAWLSLMVFWMRVLKRHYALGDFIEIEGIRGRVLDITWQTLVLAETGPGPDALGYTGRIVQVPNHRLLVTPFFVENLTGDFSLHSFVITLRPGADGLAAEQVILESAQQHCAPFLAQAQAHMDHIRKEEALDTPSVAPRVRIRFEKDGALALTVRLVVPTRERQRIEQAVVRDYLRSLDVA